MSFRLTKLSVSHLDVKFRRFKNRKYCLDIFPRFQFFIGKSFGTWDLVRDFPIWQNKIHKLFKEVTQCLGVRFYPIQIYGAISKRQAPRTRPVLDGRVQYLSYIVAGFLGEQRVGLVLWLCCSGLVAVVEVVKRCLCPGELSLYTLIFCSRTRFCVRATGQVYLT